MDWISEKITAIWNAIVAFLTPLLDGIRNTFDTIWNTISNIITTVMDWISAKITAVWNAIVAFLTPILKRHLFHNFKHLERDSEHAFFHFGYH